ncbi:MAG: pantoate--beta-alanine ligase [Candidatus Omnitrophica bacterium]|nr:pantoate--beta-alanine ligase [Candidatus Omnitrophota bacterium]MCM8790512.1 pantoate--beta-alanine ligase [Candidatus Omnitrophota bacterium]
MKLVDSIQRMATLSKMVRKEGKTIGFVPTMGYLHDGHMSLVKAAKKHTDFVVMSIFVNPIQFGPSEDFEKYPRDLKRDEELARAAGVDVIFYPSAKDMYPPGYSTYINVERLTDRLCGASRSGHFRGVTTVVAKLFNIVRPDVAYFGQKDAQQAIVIKKMVQDLNMDVEIKVMPIVRESDGLAMSSRNVYLSEDERKSALSIYEALRKAEGMVASGEIDSKKIIRAIKDVISQKASIKIDYVSIVDTKELEDLPEIKSEALIAVAAYVGKTRLIDNVIVRLSPKILPDSEKKPGVRR